MDESLRSLGIAVAMIPLAFIGCGLGTVFENTRWYFVGRAGWILYWGCVSVALWELVRLFIMAVQR
jgi:hypothetical protein